MKRVLFVIILLVMVLSGSCATDPTVFNPKRDALLSLIPDDSMVFLRFQSISAFFDRLQIGGGTIMGEKIADEITGEIRDTFGTNFFSREDLQAKGFALDAPFGIAVKLQQAGSWVSDFHTWIPDFRATFYLPAISTESVINIFKKALYAKNPSCVSEENGLVIVQKPDEHRDLVLFAQDNYVIITISNFPDFEPVAFFNALKNKAGHLGNKPGFTSLAAQVNLACDLFIYLDMANLLLSLVPQDDKSNSFIDIIASNIKTVLSLDARGKNIRLETFSSYDADSIIAGLVKNIVFDPSKIRSINKAPIFYLSGGVNWSAYYNYLKKSMSKNADLDGIVQLINISLGIDVKKDIIDNLGGGCHCALYVPSKGTALSNFLMNLPVKEEDGFSIALDKLITVLQKKGAADITVKTVANAKTYVIAIPDIKDVQLCLAVSGGNFYLTTSTEMLEEALSGAKGPGCASFIVDADAARVVQKSDFAFFIDFARVLNVLEADPLVNKDGKPVDKIARELLLFFRHFLQEARYTDSSQFTRFILATNAEENVSAGLVKLLKFIKNNSAAEEEDQRPEGILKHKN